MKFKPDWFLAGMAIAVALAWIFPEPGARGGALHPEILNKAGVALIFFLHGAGLSFAALKAGTLRWPLHLLVQSTTFLVFPLLGLVIFAAGAGFISNDLRLGLFYLCALPSTVSSSVALTAVARGNVPAAVFNATTSSLLGIFLTPLWVSAVLQTSQQSLPLGKVILDLVIWLILPLVCGQLCRPWLSGWIVRHKKFVHIADRLTILLLVYTSFCDSMRWGVWSNGGWSMVAMTAAASLALFYLAFGFTSRASHALKLPREDRIAAIFCGSKKTLASGVPMAQIMFAGHPGIGLILLPIMLYHPLQLIICGALAQCWASAREKPGAKH